MAHIASIGVTRLVPRSRIEPTPPQWRVGSTTAVASALRLRTGLPSVIRTSESINSSRLRLRERAGADPSSMLVEEPLSTPVASRATRSVLDVDVSMLSSMLVPLELSPPLLLPELPFKSRCCASRPLADDEDDDRAAAVVPDDAAGVPASLCVSDDFMEVLFIVVASEVEAATPLISIIRSRGVALLLLCAGEEEKDNLRRESAK